MIEILFISVQILNLIIINTKFVFSSGEITALENFEVHFKKLEVQNFAKVLRSNQNVQVK